MARKPRKQSTSAAPRGTRKPAAKTRTRAAGRTSARKTAKVARRPAARKATATRKPAAKAARAARTTTAKAARKPARKAPVRKAAVRKPVRKAAARKPAARKPAARKAASRKPARKTVARRAAAPRAAERKAAPARKPAARKPAVRKVTARKPAVRARKPMARVSTKPAAPRKAPAAAAVSPVPGAAPPAAAPAARTDERVASAETGAGAKRVPEAKVPAPRAKRLQQVEADEEEPLIGAPSSLDVDTRSRSAGVGVPLGAEFDEEPDDRSVTAGDADVDAQQAAFTGEEAPGGDNPTPDQDVVDLIGKALGVEYDDHQELKGGEELIERDRKRWELNPASAEDYKDRRRG